MIEMAKQITQLLLVTMRRVESATTIMALRDVVADASGLVRRELTMQEALYLLVIKVH